MSLHPYMGHTGYPEDGAVLVFAPTGREARPLVFDELRSWCDDHRFIDVRVRRLRSHVDYLVRQADPEKYRAGIAHVVDCLEVMRTLINNKPAASRGLVTTSSCSNSRIINMTARRTLINNKPAASRGLVTTASCKRRISAMQPGLVFARACS